MQAQIFSIGTEILLGNITDTNSQYLAQGLMARGINLYKMETIGDNYKRLYEAFKACDGKVDYVIASGGLGPTPDDLTKEVAIRVCDLEDEVAADDESYKMLIEYFNGNHEAAEKNIKQALFPKSAIILKNPNGTAPGCILESKNGTKYILMPGPPNEMKAMFENEVSKHLVKDSIIKSKTVKLGLLGEWEIPQYINLDVTNPTISPYITDEGPVLKVTSKAINVDEADREIEQGLATIREKLGARIITEDNIRKEEVLINLLREKNETVSTAESITGGLIASSIIDIPGASDVIKESYIVYSNEAKEKILNVSYETIKEYTLVSREVLEEMLFGLHKTTGADLCIASTGYAHTGEVYLGLLYKGKKYIKHVQINGDRNRVRLRCKIRVIDMAILIVRGDYESNFGI